MTKTEIGFFKIPTNPKQNQEWKRIIYRYRRKGGKDNFKITSTTVICEFHFVAEDIKVTVGKHKKVLKKGAIPRVFSFKKPKNVTSRKSPKKRLFKTFDAPACNTVQKETEDSNVNDISNETNEINELKQRVRELTQENLSLKSEAEELKKNFYNYDNLSGGDVRKIGKIWN